VAGLYGPRGVAVAPDGTVWVTDTGNHRVMHYDAELVLLGTFGKNGHAPDQFDGPIGIAVGDSGSVYVADAGNRRIAVLTGDGQLDRTMAFPGWQKPGEPHIEVGAGERLFVTDPEANAVVELDRSGAAIGRWTVDQAGKAFAKPTGLAIDRRRSILYVVNSGSSTVSSIRLPERKAP
jgi:DNA-binding beta-propeller fold protein YncE